MPLQIRYNLLFRQFRLLTAQAGSIPAAIRLIFENCYNYAGKKTSEVIAEGTGESYKQVERYIRLTNLIPELLEMVDQKQISFNPAVELSYLAPEEQEIFMQAMDEVQASPSLSQAQRLKKLAQEGDFTMDAAREIMNEVKKGDLERVTFRNEQLRKYFPRSYTTQQMQDTIIKLLDQWQKKKARDQER